MRTEESQLLVGVAVPWTPNPDMHVVAPHFVMLALAEIAVTEPAVGQFALAEPVVGEIAGQGVAAAVQLKR